MSLKRRCNNILLILSGKEDETGYICLINWSKLTCTNILQLNNLFYNRIVSIIYLCRAHDFLGSLFPLFPQLIFFFSTYLHFLGILILIFFFFNCGYKQYGGRIGRKKVHLCLRYREINQVVILRVFF